MPSDSGGVAWRGGVSSSLCVSLLTLSCGHSVLCHCVTRPGHHLCDVVRSDVEPDPWSTFCPQEPTDWGSGEADCVCKPRPLARV